MRSGGNSFYYIVFGALLVILGFALMTNIPSWREVMLGPAPRREQLQSSQPTNQLASANKQQEEEAAAKARAEAEARELQAKAEKAKPMAAPGLPRESQPVKEDSRPSGLFEQGKTYRYGGNEELRPFFTAPKPSYKGPLTLIDTIVYDSPNGMPLPAPSLTRTALVLIRGTRVRVSERRGDWVKVLTPAGQRGWVVARDIANLPKQAATSGDKHRQG